MIGASERRSGEFLAWEVAGRGYQVWPTPVAPEPPLRPAAVRTAHGVIDDGRKPTALSRLVRVVSERLAPPPSVLENTGEEDARLPAELVRGELVELLAFLPPEHEFNRETYAALFASLSVCAEPVTFEIIATSERIIVEFAVASVDESLVQCQLDAFLPHVTFTRSPGYLNDAWEKGGAEVAVVEFGFGREFMIPLPTLGRDPFVGLIGAMNGLRDDETAVFQVTFAPVSSGWRDAILRSVTYGDGSALFVNAPELLPAAQEKTALSLYAAVVRLGVRAQSSARAWEIACDVAGALGAYGSTTGNELIPLENSDYHPADHEADLLARQSRRSGMILNAIELAGFVHVPTGDVRASRLRKSVGRTKAAPASATDRRGLRIGTNTHAGVVSPVTLTHAQRAAHIYVIGATGTGKSTLIYNIAVRAMEAGEGISILDPHGDLIDRILAAVPQNRINDVVLLDPSDTESVVGFNILAAHSDWERRLLAADLVAVFRRFSEAWGHQLNSVLSNALLAFMESDKGGTLLDVRRFLLEPAFRSDFLKTVRDSEVVYYWKHAFPQLGGNRSVGPVVTRLDAFLAPKSIRGMVGHPENRIDFRDIMDSGRIFLARLSQGSMGRENARLLGGLIVAKMQAEAMSRERTGEADRHFHTLAVDEFHDFLTPSLAECLTGVRKYRLGFVLGHQEREQLARESEVASAVLNAHTRIVFRVNEADARVLEEGFSDFDARDLLNLPNWQAVCRIERRDFDFNLTVDPPLYPETSAGRVRRDDAIAASRRKYGTPRAEAERMIAIAPVAEPEPEAKQKKSAASAPPVSAEPSRREPQPVAIFSPAPIPDVPSAPALVSDLGKGGAQHKAIQDRVREEAERLGYRVTIEKEIANGAGQIDLVLSRGETTIACEVTVSTTIDHEVGNVSKCAKAGFRRIAVISGNDEKLRKIEAAVRNSLGVEVAGIVGFYCPDAFIATLRESPAPSERHVSVAPTRTRGGRTIKRTFIPLSDAEARAKEQEALRIMAEVMKGKRN